MSDFFDRISKLSPKRLALLAVELNEKLEAAERRGREPVAVVGMACRFPGGADDPERFWELLRAGRDAVREVPAERWDVDAYYDADPDAPGRIATRSGGFLDAVDGFDAPFFGVAPREALTMDPQQRLLLEVAWEALENAGLSPERLAGSATGVFLGICSSDHFERIVRHGEDALDAYLASGNARSVAAGRISYFLGLQGPSLAIDTACSSSLVALNVACQSLRSGESRVALCAGVNVICSPESFIALSKAHMLAPDGRCKTFDASADGFSRGEGCGVLVLKRLGDALADGDRVLAVIRGTAVNQDGRSGGLTVPNGPAQEAVIRAALADAGVAPAEVGYVEAHGTGTSLGDPIEVRALAAALGAGRPAHDPVVVGSVKTNVGHLESAAGVAGVMKVILALQHERIPPHLHFRRPSPHIAWSEYAVAVEPAGRAWPRGARRRVAGVSSFGFSGTNAHVVLEEAPLPAAPSAGPDRPVHCLPLSARTPEALAQLAARWAGAIAPPAELRLADAAHTAGAGRAHLAERLAVVAATPAEAAAALRAFAAGEAHAAVRRGTATPGQPAEVALLFGGAGGDGAGTAGALYETAPAFREVVDRCAAVLGAEGDGGAVKAALLGAGPALPPGSALAQPALVALQLAGVALLRSWGIRPAAVCGEGAGEIAAACTAGVLTLDEALRLAAGRGRAAAGAPDALAAAAAALAPRRPELSVAWSLGGGAALPGGAPDAGYWARQLREPARTAEALAALHRDGQRIFLEVGPEPGLLEVARRALPAEGTCLVPALRRGDDVWRGLVSGLAELYVRGAAVDWAGVDRPHPRRRLSLPTYPFQRQRFWIAAVPKQGAEASAATAAAALEPPERFVPATRERFAALAAANGLSIYEELLPELDRLSDAHVAVALHRLGFDQRAGRTFTAGEEAARLGIAPRHARLFGRILEMLAEDGFLVRRGSSFEVARALPAPEPEARYGGLLARFGEDNGELRNLRRCGPELARVLRGEQDPLQLLFPNGSFDEAARLYLTSPYSRTYNAALAAALQAAVAAAPAGARLRVLEVGGGTGGTTSYVLPALPADRAEYTFTDVSPLFLERAAEEFARFPFVRRALFDAERDPVAQGFEAGAYDVVIAANVLHATIDLRRSVENVQRLLAPGGLLFLLEGVGPERWVDLTYGLTEGWWRFADTALRPSYPLVSRTAWLGLLGGLGFTGAAAIPDDGWKARGAAQQALIVARAPERRPGDRPADASRPGARPEPASIPGPVPATPAEEPAALAARLASAPADGRRDLIVEFVRHEVAAVLGATPDAVPPEAGLFELGMDSLMSVNLKRRLERGAGIPLPSTVTFNHPNVAALATFLQRALGAAPDAAGPSAVATPAAGTASIATSTPTPTPTSTSTSTSTKRTPTPTPTPATDDLDALTEDELEARLIARLEKIR
jgi:acyl transferase domain-containing protein/SAM-dependent methyltransferase/acyl carrier protein